MKALKLYALVGTFALAAASALPYAFAGEVADAAKPDGKLKYSELGSHSERGVRIDELFECFKNEVPTKAAAKSKSTTVARLTPDNPLAHTSLKANNNKRLSKTMTAHTVKNGATKSAKATNHAPVELDVNSPVVTANYKGDAGDSHLLPVSHCETGVISASLDRTGKLPKYKPGEQMVVKVKAEKDCNIIVFDYDSHGTLTQLFPNAYEKNGNLHAGETVEIGGPQSQYTLDVSGKGTERIFVYAYPASESQLTVAMNPVVNTPFRSAELSIDQYRRLVNDSRPYFAEAAPTSTERTVSIKAKPTSQAAEVSNTQQANKLELVFQIDK